ncbi:MAG: DUF1730 domain-containing protein [Proteobacteria bacterium]|jgi:epoxyqueuosine reductase|nr:DUF1730 domain-containing protein [Pseudomonadota bacterium]
MTVVPREDRCETVIPGHAPPPWDFLGPAARRLGFAAAGVAPAGAVPLAASATYEAWLAEGMNAELGYASRWLAPRMDPRHVGIVEDATAVVCVAMPYGAGATTMGIWRHTAAHARGSDYHTTIRPRLERLASELVSRFPGARYRLFSDTAPILERTWAALARIGFIGMNGALIVPGIGPRVVLGEIVLARVPRPRDPGAPLVAELCRGCGACVAACPTGALRERGVIDCRSCLSYHTIENTTGGVPAALRGAVRLVFGCDACTDACPRGTGFEERCELEPPLRTGPEDLDLARIAAMPDAELARLVEGTCLERTGAVVIRRNARLAIAGRALNRPRVHGIPIP